MSWRRWRRCRRRRRWSCSVRARTRWRRRSRRPRPSIQHPPRGTGDAVRAAQPALAAHRSPAIGDVLVLFGDTPLLQPEAIAAPAAMPAAARTPRSSSPGCGRPIPAPMAVSCSAPMAGSNASSRPGTRAPKSGRSGCATAASWRSTPSMLFDLVDRIGNDNAKREFYLTDIVDIARGRGLAVPHRRAAGARRCSGSTPAPSWPRPRR